MENLLADLKQKNPELTEAEIEGLLYLLKTSSLESEVPLTNNTFIQKTGIPKETLKNFKSSLSALLQGCGENTGDSNTLALTPEGGKMLNSLTVKPYMWTILPAHFLTMQNSETEVLLHTIEEKLLAIRKKYNLNPKREYDQFFATVETSVAKATLLLAKGQITGKRICLLGDDDLVSIVLGMLSQEISMQYKQIVVFDIDQDILSVIEAIVNDLGIKNVQTELYDFRKDPKKEFTGKFDVVLTDPPYTKSGISLFLQRGVEFLKPYANAAGNYIFLFYGNSFKEPEKELKIQQIIGKYNLVVEDKVNKFATYDGAESIGSRSSLYVLKTNSYTKALKDSLPAEIYTFERTANEKFPYVDHFVFKLFKVPSQVVSSKKTLLKLCGDFCDWHGLKVVDSKLTKFKGGGLTLTFILASSNMVVHTWPEKQAVHIDLITCSPISKKEQFAQNLAELFKTKYIEVNEIE